MRIFPFGFNRKLPQEAAPLLKENKSSYQKMKKSKSSPIDLNEYLKPAEEAEKNKFKPSTDAPDLWETPVIHFGKCKRKNKTEEIAKTSFNPGYVEEDIIEV